jgi:hypothetical protein
VKKYFFVAMAAFLLATVFYPTMYESFLEDRWVLYSIKFSSPKELLFGFFAATGLIPTVIYAVWRPMGRKAKVSDLAWWAVVSAVCFLFFLITGQMVAEVTPFSFLTHSNFIAVCITWLVGFEAGFLLDRFYKEPVAENGKVIPFPNRA